MLICLFLTICISETLHGKKIRLFIRILISRRIYTVLYLTGIEPIVPLPESGVLSIKLQVHKYLEKLM